MILVFRSEWYGWSTELFFKPPFMWRFPILRDLGRCVNSNNIPQFSVHHFSSIPDSSKIDDALSLTPLTALSAIPFCIWPMKCRLTVVPSKTFTIFHQNQRITCVYHFGFSSGLRKFRDLLAVSCEVFVLHGQY